jgi:hypothetical protein
MSLLMVQKALGRGGLVLQKRWGADPGHHEHGRPSTGVPTEASG